MFARLLGKKSAPANDLRVQMPFAIVSVTSSHMPDLMSSFAKNVLRIVQTRNPSTKLAIECRTAALTIGAGTMIGCMALREAYRSGTLTKQDIEMARDLIVRTGIEIFAKDKSRARSFQTMQFMGLLPNGITLQEYELQLVRPILRTLGQLVKQGSSADSFWVSELGGMLDSVKLPRPLLTEILEFFWLDFHPMLLSAKAEMAVGLRSGMVPA
ncbi:MAG: hypothetical protein WA324_25295 [Bryobacteraceae bacterium]